MPAAPSGCNGLTAPNTLAGSRTPFPGHFSLRGLYRDDMIAAIEAMGRSWRISFTSTSLTGIQEAVASGLGISLLPPRAVTAAHRVLGSEQGFASVEGFEIAIYQRAAADAMVKELAALLEEIVERETR